MLRRSATKMSERSVQSTPGDRVFYTSLQAVTRRTESGRRLALLGLWMLAVGAYSTGISGCLILERKDFEQTVVPPSITTDDNAVHSIGDVIIFNFDEMPELQFDVTIYDSTAQLPMEARWFIDDVLVNGQREVPPNSAGGQTRLYGDAVTPLMFARAGAATGACHKLTLLVSHQFYSDSGPGESLPRNPPDIGSAVWQVIARDAATPGGTCP